MEMLAEALIAGVPMEKKEQLEALRDGLQQLKKKLSEEKPTHGECAQREWAQEEGAKGEAAQ